MNTSKVNDTAPIFKTFSQDPNKDLYLKDNKILENLKQVVQLSVHFGFERNTLKKLRRIFDAFEFRLVSAKQLKQQYDHVDEEQLYDDIANADDDAVVTSLGDELDKAHIWFLIPAACSILELHVKTEDTRYINTREGLKAIRSREVFDKSKMPVTT